MAIAFCLVLAAGVAAHAAGSGDSLSISPSMPTTADNVRLLAVVAHSTTLPISFSLERGANTFSVTAQPIDICPAFPGPYTSDFDLGSLPSGFYHVVLHAPGGDTSGSFIVSSPGKGLALAGGRFQVALLHGAVASGTQVTGGQPAAAVQLSDRSGYFWFFESGNIEVSFKILDGSGVNGHFWMFAASTTDQPFVLEVLDTQGTCSAPPCVKVYSNPAGKNQNLIDLQLFPK